MYGAGAYLARRPGDDLRGHDWVGADESHAPLAHRFARLLPDIRPVYRSNAITAVLEAAKAGIGLALPPCGLADLEPALRRVRPPLDDFVLDLWPLTHADLRQAARVRILLDFLATVLARGRDLLEGQKPEAWRAAAGQAEEAREPSGQDATARGGKAS